MGNGLHLLSLERKDYSSHFTEENGQCLCSGFEGPAPGSPVEWPFGKAVKGRLTFEAGIPRICLILNILSQRLPCYLLPRHHSSHHRTPAPRPQQSPACPPAPRSALLCLCSRSRHTRPAQIDLRERLPVLFSIRDLTSCPLRDGSDGPTVA